ncbi:hypothetical protein DEJ23_04500 [Curtobacterium sp. MCSS17_008]|uniref:hypothetical protein n=1 Tax=Curtobacterium sp. MCSS17_008 TaxID=2175647 RepID=UPI000DA98E0B|nr:hypothetical protein [Curtobacterium sp. MCSS17_008]PZF58165.1 hypothetical protein DEJ23_04500 [Curtobacterium sp. MCSS17_008]
MTAPVRVIAVLLATLVTIAVGSTTAWALWTTTGAATSSAVIGKTAAALGGTNALTTTFSAEMPSTTIPVTLRNAGTLAGTTSTAVSVVNGSSSALAQAVAVDAWPVADPVSCSTDAAVGAGAVDGTWASLPSMTSRLAAGASAVWCVRSTVTDAAPAVATAHVRLQLTVAVGSWTSTTATSSFSLNTGTADPTLTCTTEGTDDNYVLLSWDDPYRDGDTLYRAYIGDVGVGESQTGSWHQIDLAPEQLPTSTDGPLTVTVRALDAGGEPTATVAGTGTITRYTKSTGSPALRCGA